MLRAAAASLVLALALVTTAAASPETRDPAKVPPGDYVLDTRHASVTMKVAHMGGFSNYAMRFDKITGGFSYDPAALATTKLTVVIDPKSIHTGIPTFDQEIAGPRYFNAEVYPEIRFAATAVNAGADGKGTVTGDLTFMGVTKPVTLNVVFNGVGPGMMGQGHRIGFSGTGKIKRSEFGMKITPGTTGDEVALDLEVEFTKK